MRDLRELDRYRDRAGAIAWAGWAGDETCGMFTVPSPTDGRDLKVIAASGEGWDHVSVSRPTRCPNWPEMEHVKRLFFLDDETAMQLHVPTSQHISIHPYCLHIWRPHEGSIPLPPAYMVGLPSEEA